MAEKSTRLNQHRISAGLVIAAGARPVNAGDGADITGWRGAMGGYAPLWFTLFLFATAACNLTSPTGGANGVEVWMYFTDQAKWTLVGYLNKGQPIPIVGANQGYAENLEFVGIGDRLAIAAAASGGQTASGAAEPIETRVV